MSRHAKLGLAVLAIVPGAFIVLMALGAYGIDPLGIAGRPANAAPSAGALTAQATGYKVDGIELYLTPMQRVEYKYQLAEGATMVFTWSSDMPVYYDMHNVPEGRPITDSQRVVEGTGTQQHGVYIAPYAGIHGWFWENRGTTDVLVTIKAAGFFTSAVMISGDEQIPMEVQDPPQPVLQ